MGDILILFIYLFIFLYLFFYTRNAYISQKEAGNMLIKNKKFYFTEIETKNEDFK